MVSNYLKGTKMKIKLIWRTIALCFKNTPVSSSVMILYYLVSALFPAVFVMINTYIFNHVTVYIEHGDGISQVKTGIIIMIIVFVFQQMWEVVCNLIINIGVFEKNISYSRFCVFEKCASLSLIDYEIEDLNNDKDRALECVNYEKLSQLFMSVIVLISSGIGLFSVQAILAKYSLWFIPLSIISVIPYLIIRILRGKEFYYLKCKNTKNTRKLRYLWSLFIDPVTAKEMRVFQFGDYVKQQWVTLRDQINKDLWKQNSKDTFSLLLCDIIKILGYGISIVITLFLAVKKMITIGVFGSCISAFFNVQNQTKSFLVELAFLPELILYVEDYFHFIDRSVPKQADSIEYKGLKNEISLCHVSFSYPNQKAKALENINLTIKKNMKVVILGENGSGKTTLSKILMGLYQCSEGGMFIDGTNIIRLDKSQWFSFLSIVNQNFNKYQLTLRENVAMSDVLAMKMDEKIKNQLKINDLEELLNAPEGLDRQLGVLLGGSELSGGQWQKLAVARGFFKGCELIILDEPTSAIDPLTENKVLTRFNDLSKDKTTIIISHRIGLSRLADIIIIMKKGKIVEVGTHEELISMNGEYNRLYEAQSKWYQ